MSSEPLFVSFNSAWREPICCWISVKACRWCSKAGKWMLQQENGTWWLEHARTLTSNRSGAVFGATQQQNNLPAANLPSFQRSSGLHLQKLSSTLLLVRPDQKIGFRPYCSSSKWQTKHFCRCGSSFDCINVPKRPKGGTNNQEPKLKDPSNGNQNYVCTVKAYLRDPTWFRYYGMIPHFEHRMSSSCQACHISSAPFLASFSSASKELICFCTSIKTCSAHMAKNLCFTGRPLRMVSLMHLCATNQTHGQMWWWFGWSMHTQWLLRNSLQSSCTGTWAETVLCHPNNFETAAKICNAGLACFDVSVFDPNFFVSASEMLFSLTCCSACLPTK